MGISLEHGEGGGEESSAGGHVHVGGGIEGVALERVSAQIIDLDWVNGLEALGVVQLASSEFTLEKEAGDAECLTVVDVIVPGSGVVDVVVRSRGILEINFLLDHLNNDLVVNLDLKVVWVGLVLLDSIGGDNESLASFICHVNL